MIKPIPYGRCFTKVSRNPVKCKACLVGTHNTRDCDQWLASELALKLQPESMVEKLSHSLPPQQSPIRYSEEPLYLQEVSPVKDTLSAEDIPDTSCVSPLALA